MTARSPYAIALLAASVFALGARYLATLFGIVMVSHQVGGFPAAIACSRAFGRVATLTERRAARSRPGRHFASGNRFKHSLIGSLVATNAFQSRAVGDERRAAK